MKLEINRENFMREKYESELDDNTKKRIKDIKDRLEKQATLSLASSSTLKDLKTEADKITKRLP